MSHSPAPSAPSSVSQSHGPLAQVMFFPFIAPPSAGKGTQTKALVERFGFPKVDMGAMLRTIAKQDTELGQKVKERIENGLLVETSIVIDVLQEGIRQALAEHPSQGKVGFILDGFPRNQEQAEGLLSLCERTGATIEQVFYLDVPQEVIIERAINRRMCSQCGAIYNVKTQPPKQQDVCDVCGSTPLVHRADDQLDKVSVRLDAFAAETQPIVKLFQDKGMLAWLDGNRPPSAVTEELEKLIKPAL